MPRFPIPGTFRFFLVVLWGWLLLTPQPAAGQVEWRVTPGLGFYLPATTVVEVEDSGGDSVLEMKQLATAAVGLDLGVVVGPILVEAGGTYSPSRVAVTDAGGTRDVSAGVLIGRARARVRMAPVREPGDWGLDAGIGLAWLDHWGTAWEPFTDASNAGVSLTVGLGHRLRGVPVRVRLEASDYIYESEFRHRGHGRLDGDVEHDIVWGVGVVLPL